MTNQVEAEGFQITGSRHGIACDDAEKNGIEHLENWFRSSFQRRQEEGTICPTDILRTVFVGVVSLLQLQASSHLHFGFAWTSKLAMDGVSPSLTSQQPCSMPLSRLTRCAQMSSKWEAGASWVRRRSKAFYGSCRSLRHQQEHLL